MHDGADDTIDSIHPMHTTLNLSVSIDAVVFATINHSCRPDRHGLLSPALTTDAPSITLHIYIHTQHLSKR